MGENEQGGMLRTVVVIGIIAMVALIIIFGVVGLSVNTKSITNSATAGIQKEIDYGRNLYLNSRALADGYGTNGNVKVTVKPFDSTTNMWHIVAAQGGGGNVGIFLWNYADGKIPDNSDWSYSADIKGTGKASYFGIEYSDNGPVKGNIGSTWSRISQTGHFNESQNKSIVMYFDTRDSPLDVYVKLPKLETGNVPTTWTY